MLISLRTLVDSCSTMDCQPMIFHATDCSSVSQHGIIHIEQIPTDNTTKVDQDVFVQQVYIPTPAVLAPVVTDGNANTFAHTMRQSLARRINSEDTFRTD